MIKPKDSLIRNNIIGLSVIVFIPIIGYAVGFFDTPKEAVIIFISLFVANIMGDYMSQWNKNKED